MFLSGTSEKWEFSPHATIVLYELLKKVVWLKFLNLTVPTHCQTCRKQLGMADGTIKLSQIKASESIVGRDHLRLGSAKVWTPKIADANNFIQVWTSRQEPASQLMWACIPTCVISYKLFYRCKAHHLFTAGVFDRSGMAKYLHLFCKC